MNPIFLDLGFIAIRWYSIFIFIGITLAYFLTIKEAKRFNISTNFITDALFYGFPIAIIGARLYFVLFNLDYYLSNPIKIIKIWEGGLAIHGALIAGLLFAYFYAKKHKVNPLKLIDITVIGFLVGQIFGRWGNFFNGEAHGEIVNRSFLEKLYIPDFIINGMYIDGNYYHPTFLYESLWNIFGLIFLIFYRRNKKIKLGEITTIYLMWYSFGRFFIESLRTDSLMLGNLRIAQIISICLFLFGVITLILLKLKSKKLYNEGS